MYEGADPIFIYSNKFNTLKKKSTTLYISASEERTTMLWNAFRVQKFYFKVPLLYFRVKQFYFRVQQFYFRMQQFYLRVQVDDVQRHKTHLNFSKAFDCAYHPLLLVEYEKSGSTVGCVNWVKSYLTDRRQ